MVNRTSTTLMIGCSVFVALSQCACESESQIKAPARQPAVLDTAQLYNLQAKCAEESKTYFGSHWQSGPMTAHLDYSNHYSTSLNRCFILVREMTYMDKEDHWHLSSTVSDVHENADIASYYELDGKLSECHVSGQGCQSQQEWEKRVTRLMSDTESASAR